MVGGGWWRWRWMDDGWGSVVVDYESTDAISVQGGVYVDCMWRWLSWVRSEGGV
jgi:hypothetical protein